MATNEIAKPQLHDMTNDIGMWNTSVLEDMKKLLAINMTGSEVVQDQIIQLYLLMYPLIARDFAHRQDVQMWAKAQKSEMEASLKEHNAKLSQQAAELSAHAHLDSLKGLTTMPVASISAPSISGWTSLPEDKQFSFGEMLITEQSEYTRDMEHRDPARDGNMVVMKNVKTKVSTIYSAKMKFVPFDVSGDQLDTNDNSFIHRSQSV